MIAQTKPKLPVFGPRQGLLLAACGCVLIAIIVASRYVGVWDLWHPNSELESNNSEFTRTQIGMLVLHGPGDACRAYKYDNITSEILPTSGPCEITAQVDRRIIGEPASGSRQLESVSKYFTHH